MSDDSEKISGVIHLADAISVCTLSRRFEKALDAAGLIECDKVIWTADPKSGTVTFSKPPEVQS